MGYALLYKTQRYKNADALYAFKSREVGGEIGITALNNPSYR
jgi:hypothetical protein